MDFRIEIWEYDFATAVWVGLHISSNNSTAVTVTLLLWKLLAGLNNHLIKATCDIVRTLLLFFMIFLGYYPSRCSVAGS